MKNLELLNNIKEYVSVNFDGSEVELYNFLYEHIEKIGEVIEEEVEELEELEEKLIDRNSYYYKKLASIITKSNPINIKVKEIGGLYYLSPNNNDDVKEVYDKVDYILNNVGDNSKGYIFQEFALLFLEDNGIKITQRKKVNDGGLDIVGYKCGNYLINGMEQKLFVYGQIKFFKELVPTCYLKQLIKDKLYKLINENNTFIQTEATIFISHKGFFNNTKEYAKKNNIILIDTVEIIKIILGRNKNAKCLSYLNKEYQRILRK